MRKNIKNDSDLLIAKVEDKIKFCNSKNKITYTDFMQLAEKSVVIKYIKSEKISNCFWFGGVENADREILIFYPEKLTKEIVLNNIDSVLQCIHIELPKNITMEHRDYLSGIMKLGIVREKFGDIIVAENSADIIVFADMAEYFKNDLQLLTRFQKSKISIKNVTEIEQKVDKFDDVSIIVSSIRLDNIVAELSKCSRTQAKEILVVDRVFVNGMCEEKESKKINLGDVITIRGKGKYVFDSIIGTTKSNRIKLLMKKYK